MNAPYWLFGTHLRILLDEQSTHSAYDLIEGRFPAGTQTPLHLHSKYDELVYVLQGAFTVYTQGSQRSLSPGEHFFIPRHTPHVVAASTQAINRALTVASPSGFAKLIRQVGIPDAEDCLRPQQANDMGLFIELSQESGDVILGAPGVLPSLISEGGNA